MAEYLDGPSKAWRAAAERLGLAVDLDQTMTSLSGGQAARAGLASLLLSRYDVFLLDEADCGRILRELSGFTRAPSTGPTPPPEK